MDTVIRAAIMALARAVFDVWFLSLVCQPSPASQPDRRLPALLLRLTNLYEGDEREDKVVDGKATADEAVSPQRDSFKLTKKSTGPVLSN